MKLYIIEALLPHIQVQEIDAAIAQWSNSGDPATFGYAQTLMAAKSAGEARAIEEVPGDPLNVAEVFPLEDWPRVIDDFDLRRFLSDPNLPLTVDIFPPELRAVLEA